MRWSCRPSSSARTRTGWYITEWDADSGLCFGLVSGFATELGYFDLTELSEVTLFKGLPAIERDLYWNRQTLAEVRKKIGANAHP